MRILRKFKVLYSWEKKIVTKTENEKEVLAVRKKKFRRPEKSS